MADLAIKGHETRGKEVIAILEMLGGRNPHNYSADCDSLCFYISTGTNIICYDWVKDCYEDEDILVFTLEEFLEKFPYKVGDKVYNIIHNENQTITDLAWDFQENEVVYQTNNNEYVFVNYIQPYKEETMDGKYNVEKYLQVWDAAEKGLEVFVNDDFELKEDNGKFYIVKKQPQYPKTYKECCEVLRIPKNEHYIDIDAPLVPSDYNRLVSAFTKLLICRDAYWKIAGEEMGLGKPWKPDGSSGVYYFFYCVSDNRISLSAGNLYSNEVFAFPTKEMRNAFLENFEELIEICKELL